MAVAATILITRPARQHSRPDRQRLEAHIATRLKTPLAQACNSSGLESMVAGTSEDTGLAKERRRLAVQAEEVADERDEMVLENPQATFGSEVGVHRHHHSQQLGVGSPVDYD